MTNSLKDYLKKFSHICWYPSAGMDFREMMYLSKAYSKLRGWSEDIFPDCFILSDINAFMYGEMLINALKAPAVLFDDKRSVKIEALNCKELQRLDIPFEKKIAGSCDENYGRVICADIKITSNVLGELNTCLVYIIMENTSFAIDYLLKKDIKIDFIVHVRYGMGSSTGMFVKALFSALETKYFISDMNEAVNEDYAYECYFKSFENLKEAALFKTEKYVSSYRWSNSGDVYWYKLKQS